MGEVIKLNRHQPVAARLLKAHEVVEDVEVSLRLPGEAWSGLWLLARTALVRLAHYIGSERAALRAEQFAAELRASRISGMDVAQTDDEPRPAA